MTPKPKIVVLHDSFLYRGGGERLVTLMAKALDADLIAGFFSEGSFDPRELGFTGKMIALGKPVFAKGIRHLTLKDRFIRKATMLRDYDIVILSGNCLDALRHIRSDAKVFYYCHTPPRYLFDFRERYMEKFPKITRPVIAKIFDHQAKTYIRQLDRIDTIFTNSQNTHDRLLHFCGKESEILYPPTDTTKFIPKKMSDASLAQIPFSEYYLSFSRLSPPKRVDLVVDTFIEMPDKNLVFTYGKNDPQKDEILAKCAPAKNIFPMPAPSDADFIRLVQGAIANIYIPVDEDFGMSPVESMACGVPVIGVAEGGLLETVIEWKTGILVKSEKWKVKNIETENRKHIVDELVRIISTTPIAEWQAMWDASVARAYDFSLDRFIENLKKHIF